MFSLRQELEGLKVVHHPGFIAQRQRDHSAIQPLPSPISDLTAVSVTLFCSSMGIKESWSQHL